MRAISLLAVLLFIASCQAGPSDDPQDPEGVAANGGRAAGDPRPKVLLVGWDGVRPDVLKDVDTPVFDALVADGAYSDDAVTARPTVSGPCWSSILTGVWPEKHGVLSNDFSSNRYSDYPDVFTLVESVRSDLNTFAVADWLPLVAEADGGPLIGPAIDEKVVLNGYDEGWLEADSLSVDAAIEAVTERDPDFLFVYAGSPDEISHNIGGIGLEYREAIEEADRHLGRLLVAIQSRPSYADEDWLILVATDHGRTETGGHGGETLEETTIFYLASGPSAGRGSLEGSPGTVDLVTTALAHLRVPIDPAWDLDGRVVGLVR